MQTERLGDGIDVLAERHQAFDVAARQQNDLVWHFRSPSLNATAQRLESRTVLRTIQSFDRSRSATRRAISAGASSGIGNTELTLISPST